MIDHLNDLNDETPRLRCSGRNGVPPSLIFGLDSKLYLETPSAHTALAEHHDEVETITISRGSVLHHNSLHHDGHNPFHAGPKASNPAALVRDTLVSALGALPKESVWRVKGYVRFADDSQVWILNWAFGRYEFTFFARGSEGTERGQLQLTVMGARGELKIPTYRFATAVGGEIS